MADDFDEGLLVGLLVGEGHFGGDGRQPHVTLRMHERHEALFRWIERTFPGGRLYGPYEHGGRRYYQWMARGTYLRDDLVPLLRRGLTPSLDRYAHARFLRMCERYSRQLSGPGAGNADPPTAGDPGPSGAPASGGVLEESAHLRAARIFASLKAADDEGGPAGEERPFDPVARS